MSDPIIVAHNLTHVYDAGPTRRVALEDVSLTIARGSCAAIVGVTGSGKSTLAQHFNGLLRPTSGRLTVDGVEVNGTADLRALRRRVGMLFQSPEAQLFAPTVLADVAFGPRRLGLAPLEVAERARDALDAVGLPAERYGRRSPFDLSGGQMRRVALAGVLALHPAVLVLDEPTVGLDAEGREEFYAFARRAQRERGITVVLISHDMAEVASLAEQVLVLHAGRLAMAGAPRAVFAAAEQLRSYGLLAPPLAELLARLRALGVQLSEDIQTVDAALAALGGV